MKFNLLTYIFEVVNFFVLLWILKKLLYNPVISVLRRRKEYIEERIKKAEEAEKRAKELEEKYRKLMSELEKVKKEKLSEVMKEVEEEKERLYRRMKEELDAERKKFLESLEAEREEFLKEIEEEVIRSSLSFASRVLSRFADRSLHKKLFELALEVVENFGGDESVERELRSYPKVRIESAYPLGEEEVNIIREKVKDLFGVEPEVKVSVNEKLMAGVRISLASRVIDSSLEGQLSAYEKLLREKVESEGQA